MQNIKAVVLDLDGTLLTSEKIISPRALSVLQELKRKEYEVIIATARPPRSVVTLLPEFLLSNYAVYYNGALVENPLTGYREHRPLTLDVVQSVLTEIDRVGVRSFVTVECDNTWYGFSELTEEDRAMFRLKQSEGPTIVPREYIASQAITKVLFRVDEHLRHVPSMFTNVANTLVTDGGTLAQITAKEATKEAAVAALLGELGINPADVIVFGDDYNDLGLFKYCGFPVAMGNAVAELKERARLITSSNDEDGVAIVIEQLLRAVV